MSTLNLRRVVTTCGIATWLLAVVDATHHGGELTVNGMLALSVSLLAYVYRTVLREVL